MGININLRLRFAWVKKGSKGQMKGLPKSMNYSLVAAFSSKGIEGYHVVKGGVTSNDFYSFLSWMTSHHYLMSSQPINYFFDRDSIHKNKNFFKAFQRHTDLLLNSPYFPMIN